MSLGSNIEEILSKFRTVSLNEMQKVQFFRRVDTKYVFSQSHLPLILKTLLDTHHVLRINQSCIHPYETIYMDTNGYEMYHLHHRGKKMRHKIRIRNYINNDQQFFEIKRKNNKGETIKKRVPYNGVSQFPFSKECEEFIDSNSPYNINMLKPTLKNYFKRITLVDNSFSERVTIDVDLKFKDVDSLDGRQFDNVCIIELKRNLYNRNSVFLNKLQMLRTHQMSFSKYCFGLSALNDQVKKNRFKAKHLKINQL